MTPLLTIALQLVPEVVKLIAAARDLRKKYPSLTPEQIAAIVNDTTVQADAAFDHVLSQIAADHNPVPNA